MASIEVGASRIEYLEQGSGEPVVLLHSSASSASQWRALAQRLSARYRVLAPDFYGYGGSAPWPGHGAFSLAREAEIVYALLADAGEPAHLVGHSYGGAVALHIARRRPDRLRSLALVEPVAFHLLADRSEIAALSESVLRAVASGDYLRGCALFVDYWSPGAWDALPATKRVAMASRLAKVALDFHATFSERAKAEEWRAIRAPTLLVLGERSPLPTRRICELLTRMLSAARLRVVPGAGHMAPLTHAEAVNELIAEHLESNSTHGGKHEKNPQHRAGVSPHRLRQLAGAGAG